MREPLATYDFTSIMERHGKTRLSTVWAPGAPEAPQEGFDSIPMGWPI